MVDRIITTIIRNTPRDNKLSEKASQTKRNLEVYTTHKGTVKREMVDGASIEPPKKHKLRYKYKLKNNKK